MRRPLPTSIPSDVAGWGVATRPWNPQGPDTVADSVVTRTVFPPWLYPLPQGNDFTVRTIGGAKTAALPAGAGQSIVSDSIQLPPETDGVVRLMSIFVDAPSALLDVDWILRINDAPVQGYDLGTFPRVATNISIDFTGVVRVATSSRVDVLIQNNNANGPWTVGVVFSGWYWSKQAAMDLYGGIY